MPFMKRPWLTAGLVPWHSLMLPGLPGRQLVSAPVFSFCPEGSKVFLAWHL